MAGRETDVIVVGGGNAGYSAAHAASERGARVVVLEAADEANMGGNSFYTAGAFRFTHHGIDDLLDLIEEDSAGRDREAVVPAYPADAFTADMERITGGRCDPELTRVLVHDSAEAVRWLASKGVRWRLMYERQAYSTGGTWTFFGGLAVGTVDGGKGLMARHLEAARRDGVEVRHGARVTGLRRGSVGVTGVNYTDGGGRTQTLEAGAVVLAAGGFEASPRLRERYLGAGWGSALVRGNPLNTGEVIELALAAGAAPHGDWASCHSVAWDAGAAPQGGNRELTNQLTRGGYPLGIMINQRGERFVDEGADYRNYTYAAYGGEILRQPGGVAYQLFDASTRPLLRAEEYDSHPITCAEAGGLEELARRLGIDAGGLARTVAEFNSHIRDVPFDPAVLDGRRSDVDPPKSNWAVALDTPPYHGYAVTCGITFTFGGVHVDGDARVLDTAGAPIQGLHAAGEMVGGLFSGNYPGGSGLTAGTVFGRRAGYAAATG